MNKEATEWYTLSFRFKGAKLLPEGELRRRLWLLFEYSDNPNDSATIDALCVKAETPPLERLE